MTMRNPFIPEDREKAASESVAGMAFGFKFVVNPFQPENIIIVAPGLYEKIVAEYKAIGGTIEETDGVKAIVSAAAKTNEGGKG